MGDSVLPSPAHRLTQNFVVIWLDPKFDESTLDFRNSLEQLQRIAPFIETYNDAEECVLFIAEIEDSNVFMVVSPDVAQNIVPIIHQWPQIYSIYVLCGNKSLNEKWVSNIAKVNGVHDSIDPICNALEIDRQQCDQNMISVSFQGVDPLFMYTQLVKEAILQIEDNDTVSIRELVEFCRRQNNIKEYQIQMVEQQYHLHEPIWWYTAPYFMYSMLNRGLRVFDVDILLKMGFFMRQLHRQIQDVHKIQQQHQSTTLKIVGKSQFEVYRGQGLSIENFKKLKKTKRGLMSFNSFLSTSNDRMVSLRDFARPAALKTDFVGILFVMKIDTVLCEKANIPFVEMTSDIGYYTDKEHEVLFSTHNLFRIDKIQSLQDTHTDRLYQVNLTIASPDTHELKEVMESLRQNIGNREGLSRLAAIFLQTGQSKQAGHLSQVLLKEATSEEEVAEYNFQLGYAYHNQGDNAKAVKYFEEYYKIKRKTRPADHEDFHWYYSNIGIVYYNMGEYSKALSSQQQSLEIRKQALPPNHPHLAASYVNIGNVYNKMGKYTKALSSYEQSLEIHKQTLSRNHPDLAGSYSNIGSVYESIGEYSKALSLYEQSIEIMKQALPPNHPSLADSYNNIGTVYNKMGMYTKALSSYEQSLEIRKQALPPNHPSLAGSYNNIGSAYESIGEYSKALSLYEQSVEIRKRTLPWNHPNLATTYNNIGSVYNSVGEYSKALSSYQQSLEIRKQALPHNHPSLADSYNNIGTVYNKVGEYSKALSSCKQSLEIMKQALPPNHPLLAISYNNIGLVYYKMGEYSKALSSHQQSIEIGKQALPCNHPDLANSYNNIGVVYEKMKQYARAVACYEEALKILQISLPPGHRHIAMVKRNMREVRSKM